MIFCLSVIGALIAFLGFNHKPSKIFMGDTGSLALGGALAAVSIILHQELSLLVIGKRIFKMSPIHHHFEECDWSEWRIDLTFWAIGLVAAIIAVMTII